jgi:hypothetical protein
MKQNLPSKKRALMYVPAGAVRKVFGKNEFDVQWKLNENLEWSNIMSEKEKREWRLGIEWFRNDSEKEFDGKALIAGATSEELAVAVAEIATYVAITFSAYGTSEYRPLVFLPKTSDEVMERIKGNGGYWFHVFHKPTMDGMRQNMFDADKDAEPTERSFEEVMAESSEPLKLPEQIPEHDRYFNHRGEEINGLPDFWALQAGLV